MTWRCVVGAGLAACVMGLAISPAAEKKAAQKTSGKDSSAASVEYVPLGAPEGMSAAVVVPDQPMVYTRQILPLDRDGKVVGADSVDKQIGQVLDNLEAVLKGAGSGFNKLVRVYVYALAPSTVDRFRAQLSKRLPAPVRPAITAVLTPLPNAKAFVAADAVAAAAEKGQTVSLQKAEGVAGDKQCADAAVMPAGGVAYLSGVPEEGGLTSSAVARSISILFRTLKQLKLAPADVVQLRVFLKPALAAEEVLGELKKLFPGQDVPPVTFVEWIAPLPVEIELVAYLPSGAKSVKGLEYYTPPDVRPAHTFSRVALVRAPRQIFVSGLFALEPGKGEAQATDVFEQLKAILEKTGSDLDHLAKASYYVTDDDAGRGFDRVRPRFFDQEHPPAASKVTVFGVGQAQRTLTMDMIAVPK